MTWLLLAFTGWAVVITNQHQEPTCVAHAVATCGSLYGYESNPDVYAERLWIWVKWYNVWKLPNWLPELNIGSPKVYNREDAKTLLSRWPVILNIWSKTVRLWLRRVTRHAVCAVWYNDNHIIIADSQGTGMWQQWYFKVKSWDLQFVTLQTLWHKTLTPSLITLIEKKEDLQESKPAVASRTTNARNTRRKFLKPLD